MNNQSKFNASIQGTFQVTRRVETPVPVGKLSRLVFNANCKLEKGGWIKLAFWETLAEEANLDLKEGTVIEVRGSFSYPAWKNKQGGFSSQPLITVSSFQVKEGGLRAAQVMAQASQHGAQANVTPSIATQENITEDDVPF